MSSRRVGLEKHGYLQSKLTPGFWKHKWRPISFSLVVDDFGVKYVGKQHITHLINALKENYEISQDWAGSKYCGLELDWDYKRREVHLSMPGYVAKALQRFNHKVESRRQYQPHQHVVPAYGAKVQLATPLDESEELSKDDKKIYSKYWLHVCIMGELLTAPCSQHSAQLH